MLDPHLETADSDLADNRFPREQEEGVNTLKGSSKDSKNPMQEEADRKKAEVESAE